MRNRIQIQGQQASQSFRTRCLDYMRAVYELANGQVSTATDLDNVQRVTCIRTMEADSGHAQPDAIICTSVNWPGRLEALSDTFIFDSARDGLICALLGSPKASHAHLLTGGIHLRPQHRNILPLEAVTVLVMAETYVPGATYQDEMGWSKRWTTAIRGIQTPRGCGLVGQPWLRFLARNAPEAELPLLTVKLHRAAQAYLNGVTVQADWREITLQEMGPMAELAEEEMTALSIDELELSVRAHSALERAGVETIGELISRSTADLLSGRYFGRKSLREVRSTLEFLGARLTTVHGATSGL